MSNHPRPAVFLVDKTGIDRLVAVCETHRIAERIQADLPGSTIRAVRYVTYQKPVGNNPYKPHHESSY